ncbi:MAG: SAM-dependent chlorinase/fluorinase [Proteobacteria bacterium]|nr:SAM-dependent chlorinase/fluorinase [Pseudomonadota bacterium]MDA0993816.1 SAM-dependent chlorinase/fluorinase [Pseudomonadota bacterium]
MTDWQASGVITVTTDFGHKGPFAAVMTGVIVKRFPQARVIDLAHDIPAHWPPEAGFWLSRSFSYFPTGTVHVAIVDPGVGTEREILLALKDGHLFMAPDNGLLAPILEVADKVYKLNHDALTVIGAGVPSLTFHGRDIFAPIAAELAAGRIGIDDISIETREWTPGWLEDPECSNGRVSGIVVTVDAFGNLISNIDASLIDGIKSPLVHIAGHHIEMKHTYGRVKPGEYLALINSFGVIEIARSEESAADGLGCERGAPVVVSDAGKDQATSL